MPARRQAMLGLTAVAVAVATGAGFGIAGAVDGDPDGTQNRSSARTFDGTTDEIVRGDLEGSTTASGTLRFAGERTIQAAGSGIVTELPAPGSVVKLGGRLYAVDNVPVLLLRGGLPAWRTFESGMDDGPDVRQLERSLRELGHFSPEPDDEFDWYTRDAIEAWQDAAGLDETGALPLGSVVFADGAVRVGTHTATVGDRVGPGAALYSSTGTAQVVDIDLDLADQALAVKGKKVELRLPDGSATTGTISSVGTPTEKDSSGGGMETVVPIVVALDDPAAAKSFQEATVTADIPSERREDVLSVPVEALLALDARRFGVEVVDGDGRTRKVPVTTGLFTSGRVEVSGEGVAEGRRVVVPSR